MRLFLALELSDAVRAHLAECARDWLAGRESSGALVRAENLHVTVKFLGEVPESKVAPLCDALQSVPTASPAQVFPDRLEFLPERGPIRIVSAGLGGELDKLHLLHKRIEVACEGMGFARERRRYRPHVTLIRFRRPLAPHDRSSASTKSAGHFPGPVFAVQDFVLMQSELHPSGAKYIPLARFPLSG